MLRDVVTKLLLQRDKKRPGWQGEVNVPESAQDSIPYRSMYADGVCMVTKNYFTKTIQFYDINYQLALNEDKTTIFENYCNFLNYFDSSIHFQMSFLNQHADIKELEKVIDIAGQNDDFEDLREEYRVMLKKQLAKGNNGLVKTKYITFGIEAESLKIARPRLERIESDILNNFKVMGSFAKVLDGRERLEVMYRMFTQDKIEPFRFEYGMLKESGLSTKDYIAPTSFNFSKNQTFMMGKTIGTCSYLQILAPEINDRMLSDFLDVDDNISINIHIQSIDQAEAIKMIKHKLSDLDKMKIEEQKKAVRAGYDMEIIPSDLATYADEAKKLLEDLQSRNERLFLVNVIIMNTAQNRQKLDNNVFQVQGIAQKYNCSVKPLDYQQEGALFSSIPLGINRIEIQRALTTSSTAIFIPFTTQELFQTGEALYYGLNALSNNLIMVDRKKLKNPNGLILGVPGSGKSFATKREFLGVFFTTPDDILISDPEGEYGPLVKALGGTEIKISAKSQHFINPMDVNLDIIYHPELYRVNGEVEDVDTVIADKSEFITSFCELIMKKPQNAELDGDEISIIDRCVKEIYEEYLYNSPKEEEMPTLQDFWERLEHYAPENDAAKRISSSLELYVTGSQNIFNHRTNVDMNNRIICFNIKELGSTLRKAGMLIVQNTVWTRVSRNRALNKSTRYVADEFHLLLAQPQTAAYSVEIWKRFRKWGGIPTAVTQNIKDLLASREIENIFENSDFIIMLSQAQGDREILAKQLGISEQQLSYVKNANEGEGLLFYGNTIIPFVDKFPKNKLYDLMTTKPDEVAKRKKEEADGR